MTIRKFLPAVALLVAACGGAASASGGTPSPSPSARVRNGAFGQLVKITGSSLILSAQSGDTDVDFDSSTRVQRTSSASVGDIVPGVCLFATGQKDSTGAVTAAVVRLSNPVDGSCAPQRTATPSPGAFGGGGIFGGGPRVRATPPANFGLVAGLVTAVSGTQVSLQPLGGSVSSVTVPTTVTVSRTEAATTADLQVGECISAAGRRDSAGTVHAASLTISPPNASGTCSAGFGGGFFRSGGGGGGFFGGGGGGFGGGG